MVRTRRPSIPRPIRAWTARKLEYLDAYLQAYVVATKASGERYYVDGFAGCGDCVLQETGLSVAGSAWRALAANPPFTRYYFVEKDAPSATHLRRRIGQRSDADVLTGDCNVIIPREVLPNLPTRAPSFAFLDPSGIQLDWDTVRALARHRVGGQRMELLILYPYDMAIAFELPISRLRERLTRFFGDTGWDAEYQASLRMAESADQRRERFTRLYVGNLKGLGYRYVVPYGPLKDHNRSKYSVIFASDNNVGLKIMEDVWSKPRYVPGEMFYRPIRRPKAGASVSWSPP